MQAEPNSEDHLTRLLLVLPLRTTGSFEDLLIESQAHNGLRLWLKHFDTVTLMCLHSQVATEPQRRLSELDGRDRIRVVSLPEAWLPHKFVRSLPATIKTLSDEIDKADILLFGIGGLVGDWPSIAAIIASAKRRPFAVWTDRVESNAHSLRAQSKTGFSRLYTKATALAMSPYERLIIRRAALGLFHGFDCFSAYEAYSKNPHLVHDIHIRQDQQISEEDLSARLAKQWGTLRLVYAGRVSPEKGPLDWVRAIAKVASDGIAVEGTWFGSGPELANAVRLASELDCPVTFPGPLPHSHLLEALKSFDAFVFCHKTLESPRCLIEALACGLPIVGYESAYPRDLISKNRGGLMVEPSPDALAEAIKFLAKSRPLEALSTAARRDGAEFTDERVFAHRSALLRTHLQKSFQLP